MKIRKKHILFIAAGAVAVLVGFGIYRRAATGTAGNSGGGRSQNAVAVEVVQVAEETIRETGFFSGSLQARSRFIVSPKIGGRLVRLYADVGDRVVRGQLLARLDDTEYVQQLEQAKADLEVSAANLEDAKGNLQTQGRELDRVKTLFQSKIASQTELDQVSNQYNKTEAQLKVVQAQMRLKEAALETAKLRLSYTKLLAEWESSEESRVIGERLAEEGALLKANDPVFSILDIGSLTATFNVTESAYPRMRIGLGASVVSDVFPGMTFPGRVQRVAPFINEATRQAEIRLEVPNQKGVLKPGLFVRVSIEYGRKEKARVVPLSAVVKRNEREGVFMVEPDGSSVRFVPVSVGVTDENKAEIVSPAGLKGAVVVLGQHLLMDGSKIVLPSGGNSKARGDAAPNLGEAGPDGKIRSPGDKQGAPQEKSKRKNTGS